MKTDSVRHIRQGELFFGRYDGILKTLVGSCVAIVLWNGERKLGGMCHIVLPSTHHKSVCDARFANCAIEEFIEEFTASGMKTGDFWVGVYGGGNMFPGIKPYGEQPVGEQNIDAVCKLLKHGGFRIAQKNLGGSVYRTLSLDMRTGEVVFKNIDVPDPSGNGLTIDVKN